jgi:hypothetical protein
MRFVVAVVLVDARVTSPKFPPQICVPISTVDIGNGVGCRVA